jgi:hypothetical protein
MRDTPVRFASWNLDGWLAAGLTNSQFVEFVRSLDVLFVQETHLREEQHDTIEVPDGFKLYARSRRRRLPGCPYGGVAALVRASMPSSLRDDLCGPDFIAVQVGDTVFYNSYMLPDNSTSNIDEWSDIHPWDALVASIARAQNQGLRIVLLGDLNGRIGNRRPSGGFCPARETVDRNVNTRGRDIIDMCSTFELVPVNGCEGVPGDHTEWTSYQGFTKEGLPRRAVVDLCLCSASLLPCIVELRVS